MVCPAEGHGDDEWMAIRIRGRESLLFGPPGPSGVEGTTRGIRITPQPKSSLTLQVFFLLFVSHEVQYLQPVSIRKGSITKAKEFCLCR